MGNLFKEDLTFLRAHTDVVELQSQSGQVVLVAPEWQARVMTSAPNRDSNLSPGWINYEWITNRPNLPHINPMGGEERLWLGPEAGQYSWFFKPGEPYDLDHWQTPPLIDTERFVVTEQSSSSINAKAEAKLFNASGTEFSFHLQRNIAILDENQLTSLIGTNLYQDVEYVSYRSINSIKNTSDFEWTRDTGMPSLWILNMLKHSPDAVVLIPYKKSVNSTTELEINDSYFGKIPSNRLIHNDEAIFFRADGAYRSKLGLSPKYSLGRLASIDPKQQVLTIVIFDRKFDDKCYVNSLWEHQKDPFDGDVLNAYNDGPPKIGGTTLGPFYELENSSPALNLKSGETASHKSQTIHFHGKMDRLTQIAKEVLKIDIEECMRNDFWTSL